MNSVELFYYQIATGMTFHDDGMFSAVVGFVVVLSCSRFIFQIKLLKCIYLLFGKMIKKKQPTVVQL